MEGLKQLLWFSQPVSLKRRFFQNIRTESGAVGGSNLTVCLPFMHAVDSECVFSGTDQHDHTPVEDSSVVAVAAGRAQQRLLQDVAAAGKTARSVRTRTRQQQQQQRLKRVHPYPNVVFLQK